MTDEDDENATPPAHLAHLRGMDLVHIPLQP